LFPLNLASLGHLFQKESFEEVTLAFHFGLPSETYLLKMKNDKVYES
jgi:hypothetical protein